MSNLGLITVLALVGVAILLTLVQFVNVRSLIAERAGRLTLLVGMVVVPGAAGVLGTTQSMHMATQTQFCAGCHEMQPYFASLHYDDEEVVPAVHYQNNLMPRDQACYTCHSDYTLFGDVKAKLTGLKHVWVHYQGAPEDIALYKPFSNDNCLSCHDGSRRWEGSKHHNSEDASLSDIKSGNVGCTSSGCHEAIHDVKYREDYDLWMPEGGSLDGAPELEPAT